MPPCSLSHARASAVRISLRRQAQHWRLQVEDDGRGGAIRPGNGLAGMRARVAALGGTIKLQGENGMRIEAVLPLPASA